jgi:hypothetical protein
MTTWEKETWAIITLPGKPSWQPNEVKFAGGFTRRKEMM